MGGTEGEDVGGGRVCVDACYWIVGGMRWGIFGSMGWKKYGLVVGVIFVIILSSFLPTYSFSHVEQFIAWQSFTSSLHNER